jgi:hypothetical protein
MLDTWPSIAKKYLRGSSGRQRITLVGKALSTYRKRPILLQPQDQPCKIGRKVFTGDSARLSHKRQNLFAFTSRNALQVPGAARLHKKPALHATGTFERPCVRSNAMLPILFQAFTEPMRARNTQWKSECYFNCTAINGLWNDSESGPNARRALCFPGVL